MSNSPSPIPSDMSDDEFVRHVRTWLRANLPEDMLARARVEPQPSREDQLAITAILHKAGWSVPAWPVEYGGTGWSPMRRHLFDRELAIIGAPEINAQGPVMVGPIIYTFGTQDQKDRYLAGIREGRTLWAQGFSEPNAGSDLASLTTRAVREGEGADAVYVINGQKIWTTNAYKADMLFCLVRTDTSVKAQKGISFLLLPTNTPGLTIRPILSIDEREHLCETFFDNVRVPAANLIGEENRGWDYAKFLLNGERGFTAFVGPNRYNLDKLTRMAKAAPSGKAGKRLYDEVGFRNRLAELEVDMLALEAEAIQAIELDDDGALVPSAMKVHGTGLLQATHAMQVESLGAYGAGFQPPVWETDALAPPAQPDALGAPTNFMFWRAATIAGGTTEIQKNIVAKLIFAGHEAPRAPLSEDQTLLTQSAERLSDSYRKQPWHARSGGDPVAAQTRWKALADPGFLALGVPEHLGGLGGSHEDQAALYEALGQGGVMEPFGNCSLVPGYLLSHAEWEDARKAEYLERLISGEQVFAFAHGEYATGDQGLSPDRIEARAERVEGGFRLTAAKSFVTGGPIAGAFLISAQMSGADGRAEGVGLFLVPADLQGVSRHPYRSIDGEVVADLRCADVALPADALIIAPPVAAARIEEAMDLAQVMFSAEIVGAMNAMVMLVRDHLATRRQFGQPLAEFQALRHRVADMYGEIMASRALLKTAVATLAAGDAKHRARLVSALKARVERGATFVGNNAVQLHGGMGMTQECAVSGYFRRTQAYKPAWGSARLHLDRFSALLEEREGADAGHSVDRG